MVPDFYCRNLNISPHVPILSHIHPVNEIQTISRRYILVLSSNLLPGLSINLFPSGFPIKILYAPLPFPYVPHALPKPAARSFQVAETHQLQIWMHALGICKISKTNMPINPLKDIQVLPLLNRRGWKQLIFKKCINMEDVLRNVIQRIL